MKTAHLIVVLGGILFIASAQATTFTVSSTADNGAGTLREALASVANGDTIDATGVSGSILLTSGELLVTNSVTILGPGPATLAVDGNATSRVFYVQSGLTVTMAGLTITNGLATGAWIDKMGGGIYNDRSTLTVSNCTLSSNSADRGGGGIYSEGGTVLVIDCTVSDNSGDCGGGLYSYGYGEINATLTVVGSTVSDNSASSGAGIYNSGIGGSATLTVTSSTIISNTSSMGGGGIYSDGSNSGHATLTVSNSAIIANSSITAAGGGILNSGYNAGTGTLTVVNSTLSDNSAAYGGGGIYNDGYQGTVTVIVANCTLSDNFASAYGGGIFLYVEDGLGELTVVNSTLSSNSVDNGDGGGIYVSRYTGTSTVTVANSTLSDNVATDGGGIYHEGDGGSGMMTVTGSVLIGNLANDGGGIYNDGSHEGTATLMIADSIVTSNTATTGGGIYNNGSAAGSATLAMTNSICSGNGAHDGGGIYSDGEAGSATLTLVASTVNSNAAFYGGGIYNDGEAGSATLTVTDSSLSGNLGATGGGGIFNYGSEGSATLAVSSSTLSGNSGNDGGGIYSWASYGTTTVTVANSTLSSNAADFVSGTGGGIYNDGTYGNATLSLTNCTLSGNSAGAGGAVYSDGESSGTATLILAYSTLSGNWDDDFAGGIYNEGDSATVQIVSTILNAGSSGANIVNEFGTVVSHGYNLSSDDAGGFLTATGDLINTDPRLGPLADNGGPTYTHALLPCSPAIDAGDPGFAAPPDYDQRGVGYPRVVLSVIDIGAFETLATTCAYAIQPASYTVGMTGGSAAFSVTPRTVDCVWTPTSNDAFIEITGTEPGPGGQGNVLYSVAANSGGPRTGTVSVACQTFVVVQEGCIFSISPTNATFGAVVGSGSVTVSASSSNCEWTALSNDGFITIDAGSSGSGNGSVSYTVAANPSNSARSGTMTIAGKAFTVTQSGATADIRLTMSAAKSSAKGKTYITYTLTVTNAGPSTAINVVVTDPVPYGTTFFSASANNGSFTKPPVGGTGNVTWTVGDLLNNGATTAQIQITVTVKGKSSISNTATATSDTTDPNTSNNTAVNNTSTKGK